MTENDIFKFEVSENGTTKKWTVENEAGGKIKYPTISYTLDDIGLHTYTVKETSVSGNGITVSTKTYTVTVDVKDAVIYSSARTVSSTTVCPALLRSMAKRTPGSSGRGELMITKS